MTVSSCFGFSISFFYLSIFLYRSICLYPFYNYLLSAGTLWSLSSSCSFFFALNLFLWSLLVNYELIFINYFLNSSFFLFNFTNLASFYYFLLTELFSATEAALFGSTWKLSFGISLITEAYNLWLGSYKLSLRLFLLSFSAVILLFIWDINDISSNE